MKIPPPLRFSRTRQEIKRATLGTITHFSTSDAVAALTFDDGPSPEFTPEILRILAEHGAKATFFMIGETAGNNPDIVRQVAQQGHTIGNHSWNHPSFVNLSVTEQIFQIRECAKIIGPFGTRFFRPPFGHQTLQSRLVATWCRQRVVTWSVASHDWCDDDPQAIARRVLNGIRPGAIVLFHGRLHSVPAGHEKYLDRAPMFEALQIVLRQLRGVYRFVSMTDMFSHGTPVLKNWYRM